MPLKIQQGQVWRLLTFALLHANLIHVVMNIFTQIIIGSFMESYMGTMKWMILYIAAK